MKKTLKWWGCCALLIASAPLACADGTAATSIAKPDETLAPPPAGTVMPKPLPATVSTAPSAIDGVEFSPADSAETIERSRAIQAQQNDPRQLSYQKAQEEAAAKTKTQDSDWMLRDYQARLKQQGLMQTPNTGSALGSPSPDSQATADTDPLLAPLYPSKPTASFPEKDPLKSDSTKDFAPVKLPTLASFQPLLPPLKAPAAKAPRNAWESAARAADTASTTYWRPQSRDPAESGRTSSTLDIPGLTASENGMGPVADLNFPQDPLPDESPAASRQRRITERNNFLLPTSPTSDVSEFFKKQADAFQPATPLTAIRPATVATKTILPFPTKPKLKAQPAVSGLRSHVDDPFDFLYR